jgi:predicted nucleic acid-binding protein
VDLLLAAYTHLPDPPDLRHRWLELCVRERVAGKRAHDARLAALALSHGIRHVLTLNPHDFLRSPELTVLTPQDI